MRVLGSPGAARPATRVDKRRSRCAALPATRLPAKEKTKKKRTRTPDDTSPAGPATCRRYTSHCYGAPFLSRPDERDHIRTNEVRGRRSRSRPIWRSGARTGCSAAQSTRDRLASRLDTAIVHGARNIGGVEQSGAYAPRFARVGIDRPASDFKDDSSGGGGRVERAEAAKVLVSLADDAIVRN